LEHSTFWGKIFLIITFYLSDMNKKNIVMILIFDFHFLIVMIIWDLKFCIGDFGILFLCPNFKYRAHNIFFTQNSSSSKDTPKELGLIFLLLNF